MRTTLLLLMAVAAHAQSFEVASIRVHSLAVDQPLVKNPDADPVRIAGNRVIAKSGVKIKRTAADGSPSPGMRRGRMDQLAALPSLLLDRPSSN